MKTVIGLAIAFAIGAACRWFELPVPAPPKLLGALLIMAITLGYGLADRFVARSAGNGLREHAVEGPAR